MKPKSSRVSKRLSPAYLNKRVVLVADTHNHPVYGTEIPGDSRRMRESKDPISLDRELEKFPPAVAGGFRKVMPVVPHAMHRRLLLLTGDVYTLSSPAASEFLKNCSFVVSRAGLAGLETWCEDGLGILRQSEQSGITYFGLGMSRSTMLVEKLSSGVELDSIRSLLETYHLALTGMNSPILSTNSHGDYRAGLSTLPEINDNGHPFFLPEFVDRYPDKQDNFAWYKVMATHQAGHIEYGSYEFHSNGTSVDPDGFLELIGDSRLAADIFTIVEDGRIDFLVKQQYKGLAGVYRRIQKEALDARPPLTVYRQKEAFLEALIRLSLGRFGQWSAPKELCTPLYISGLIMKRILSSGTTVDDSIEATMQLYRLACKISNEPVPGDTWQTVNLDKVPAEIEPLTPLQADKILLDMSGMEPQASMYTSPPDVEYRGIRTADPDIGFEEPESISEDNTGQGSPQPKLPAPGEESDIDDISDIGALAADKGTTEEDALVFGANTMNSENVQWATQPEQADTGDNNDGPLEADGPYSYLYNEWDFRASDYRLRWCRVRQTAQDEGAPEFFDATLDEYKDLASLLRKQFELLNPRFSRKVKKLQDGEDFDLDAVIDHIITRKAKQNPDGKVYWRRSKSERDVSVAFLLDMSSSTIEYVNKSPGHSNSQPVFRDYKDYFEWLQAGNDSVIRPLEFKRIIDLEKESLVLLIRALESIGDTYAIYGFSGYGRENVEFYIIKDLEEEFSNQVKSRIDTISPQHGTRMGPAIRHATWKLEQQESKSKFLFLISDGRPEDHRYGQDGLEREYAIHDTKMALVETKRKGVMPFCLTIDQDGHDYLKTICGDMGYEVVPDIESLPRCLPTLYRRFTT